ncbi:pyridoxamine 5'-phosphate oxidase family protein [Streptomyces sp. NPDC004362]|uniref:pyridoxamine 5'-phosphate oxidase family protein n=1 Tax=Streptomyces sp. NPDC004362 TaxID=3154456 RepID=UPI0033B4D69F
MDDFLIPRALTSEAQLRELYAAPGERAVRKELDHIDEMSRRLIAVSPVVFVATSDADGRCDVAPRGGTPGFVTVLDERHVVIPDATGNTGWTVIATSWPTVTPGSTSSSPVGTRRFVSTAQPGSRPMGTCLRG